LSKTPSGSVSLFVAWMSEHTEVSDSELAKLEAPTMRHAMSGDPLPGCSAPRYVPQRSASGHG
jgi:hypothetical protein